MLWRTIDMETRRREARYYVAANGKAPCEEWLENLKDRQGRTIIKARLRRMEMGNPGSHRFIGQGITELKIDFGPGYRVYFGEDGETLVILLCGGDKSTQESDIFKAREYWKDYRERR